jgi:transcriptional regulator with XRE-family HTH domain
MQQISGYEKGKYRPRPERLPILLKALGVEFFHVATYVSPQSETAG